MSKQFNSNITTIDIETLHTQITVLKRYDLNAPYQRDIVWNEKKQSLFVNSIIVGIVPTPLIFTDKGPNEGGRTVIDGKQRVTSIMRFKNNEIGCEFNDSIIYYDKLPLSSDVNYKYRILSDDEKTSFNRSNLNCVTYYNLSYEDELLIFNRIQNGVAMSSSDLLKASAKDENSNLVLNKFYESLVGVLGKYSNNSNKEKSNHIILITNVMYMIKYNKLKTFREADRTLVIKEYHDVLDKTANLINDIFPWLNRNPTKLCNYMLYPVIYHRYKTARYINNLDDFIKSVKDNNVKKDYLSIYKHIDDANLATLT